METSGLKDAYGLVNTAGGPAHGSQREPELAGVRIDLGHIAQDDDCQFARGLLAHPRVGSRDPDPCPAGCVEDGLCNGVVLDSHDALEHI